MGLAGELLLMLAFAIIILIVYNVLKLYVLSKIKINKWIVFILAVIVLLLPTIVANLGVQLPKNLWWQYITSGIFMILFLWFMDLSGWINRKKPDSKNSSSSGTYIGYGKKDNKKDVVIKPKAKPNRVKNKKD